MWQAIGTFLNLSDLSRNGRQGILRTRLAAISRGACRPLCMSPVCVCAPKRFIHGVPTVVSQKTYHYRCSLGVAGQPEVARQAGSTLARRCGLAWCGATPQGETGGCTLRLEDGIGPEKQGCQ